MRFLPLEKLINLHDGYRKTVKVDSLEVLLIQDSGALYIVQSRCPHRGQHLEAGTVIGPKIECPWHHFVFDLVTGAHEGGACEALAVHSPVFQGNLLGIMIDD